MEPARGLDGKSQVAAQPEHPDEPQSARVCLDFFQGCCVTHMWTTSGERNRTLIICMGRQVQGTSEGLGGKQRKGTSHQTKPCLFLECHDIRAAYCDTLMAGGHVCTHTCVHTHSVPSHNKAGRCPWRRHAFLHVCSGSCTSGSAGGGK